MFYSFVSIHLLLAGLLVNTEFTSKNKIIIEMDLSLKTIENQTINWASFDFICNDTKWKKKIPYRIGNTVKWSWLSSSPLLIQEPQLTGFSFRGIIEPGDSIHVAYRNGKLEYSGDGADKFQFLTDINNAFGKIPQTKTKLHKIPESLTEFFEWNSYLDKKINTVNELKKRYAPKIKASSMSYIEACIISQLEYYRLYKFQLTCKRSKVYGISSAELCSVYDSVIATPLNDRLLAFPENTGNALYLYQFIKLAAQRDLHFNIEVIDQINQSMNRKILYYLKAKELLKKEAFENFMVYLLTTEGLNEGFMERPVEQILKAYYASPGFPDHKLFVKMYEDATIERNLFRGGIAPEIMLFDKQNQSYSLSSMKGEPVLLYFRNKNCASCSDTEREIEEVWNKYNKRFKILEIWVEHDREAWQQQMELHQTGIAGATRLYAGNQDNLNSILKGLNINEYPSLHLIDQSGNFVDCLLPDPAKDKGSHLGRLISHQQALLNDGPYILHTNDSIISFVFRQQEAKRSTYPASSKKNFLSGTDLAESFFSFPLKEKLRIEPSSYKAPKKLLALSDIEGNFDAFRKLLYVSGVIDEQFNWIFGQGHLVFAGDMFDRGEQVTECLWLVYALEEKAKAAGGYVHFILGNHEIMNLSNDIRYVHKKYLNNSNIIKTKYVSLFDKSSELGRWLRTKNIMEKIGHLLFTHAGISSPVVQLPLDIEQINETARKYYDNQSLAAASSNPAISALYNSASSPFWYRKYYREEKKTPESLIDSTMAKFGVSHIITGHTIVADTISVHYQGKVFNTDTRHKSGKSEALLLEKGAFYRIDQEGSKKKIFHAENLQ